MKKRKIKVVITNLEEFLKVSNPINSIYKSCFKCLAELEDVVIRQRELNLPIDYVPGNIEMIEYKECGYYIFNFVEADIDEFDNLLYFFEYRGTAS